MPSERRWEIRLCGPIAVAAGGRRAEQGLPGRQGRLLFAYLVRHRDRVASRAELVDVLWPERPPAAADAALSALLSKLRRTLGDGVVGGRGGLQLLLGPDVDVDVDGAEAEAARAEAAIDAGDWAAALAHGRAATSVDGASFLPDCDGPWLHEQRRDLDAIRLRGLEAVALAALRQGGRELQTAEQAARAAVALAPFRESAHILLMEAHEAAGNPAEALRAFEELRSLLREELGTMPGAAALAVHERVLRGDPPPAQAPAPRVVTAHPWPATLGELTERHRFVGRGDETDSLEALLEEARSGARRLVLLAGDAGIGKTRLAAELGRRAHADGAVVLYGRCDEETLAAYQPLVEMLRGWSGGASLEALGGPLGARGAELGVVLPEFGAPSAPSGSSLRGEEAHDAQRQRFFDAVAALLAEIGAEAPLVLVVDDLHWADRPTLQLLRHLVRGPQPAPALFVGTYREAELEPDHPLRELIAGLRREGSLRRVELGGLEVSEVAELVAALDGGDPSSEFLAALHAETEGNPFFIEEVVQHLLAGAGDLGDARALAAAGVPDGVREVIARRLRRLAEPAREALTVAALIGREFDYDTLEAVAGLDADVLVAALDEAVDARVLREGEQVGRYQFAHALIRATLSDGVSALRGARLHGRIGEAILARRGGDLDAWLPQLARHFEEAAPVEQPERAADFALAAARRADRLLAWEEAAEHYRAALRARELAATVADPVRADLLLALGTSQQRAGLENVARATFAQAGDTARRLGEPALLGRAALGFAGPWSTLARVDEEVVARLDEALVALGDEDSPLRARLLARLAFELYYSGDPGRREVLSEEAVAIARRLGDPQTLATCLDARHYALWRPENVEERLAVAAEMRQIAEETGDPELELEGAGWTVVDLLELGDVEGADIQIAAATELADALQLPLYRWWTAVMRCTRAQIGGDFGEAERLAQRALELGQRGQAENATNYYAMALFNIRREQGRLAELEGAVRRFVELYPALPAWRCTLALLLVELGRPDEARDVFDALAEPGFDALPRDANWLIAVTLLAEVCGALGDAERASELHRMLAPYAGRNVIVGRAATCNGAAARLLGILAATMGDGDAAARRFDEADALHAAMGARPWIAHTQLARAAMLLARAEGADRNHVRGLLADAIVLADALGMVSVAARARQLVAAAGSGAVGSAGGSAGSVSAGGLADGSAGAGGSAAVGARGDTGVPPLGGAAVR